MMEASPAELLADTLRGLERDEHGIYGATSQKASQADELVLREKVANATHTDYLREVARHHSVPVMDLEVLRFLTQIPRGSIVVDVGGCWGWHWRKLARTRPDVAVVIVDFCRTNLLHARNVLRDLVGTQVALVHGDATNLPFADNTFAGYWSVQTLQHVPELEHCLQEAHRVLRRGGVFANYSLNRAAVAEFIYRIAGRKYHIEGQIPGMYYLARAGKRDGDLTRNVFEANVETRYSEILFQPSFGLRFGDEGSLLARLDSWLSGSWVVLRHFARQCSFHATKQA